MAGLEGQALLKHRRWYVFAAVVIAILVPAATNTASGLDAGIPALRLARDHAIAREITLAGNCSESARYRTGVNNSRRGVNVVAVVNRAGRLATWRGEVTRTYRTGLGDIVSSSALAEWESSRAGRIRVDADMPGRYWHHVKIFMRRAGTSEICLIDVRF